MSSNNENEVPITRASHEKIRRNREAVAVRRLRECMQIMTPKAMVKFERADTLELAADALQELVRVGWAPGKEANLSSFFDEMAKKDVSPSSTKKKTQAKPSSTPLPPSSLPSPPSSASSGPLPVKRSPPSLGPSPLPSSTPSSSVSLPSSFLTPPTPSTTGLPMRPLAASPLNPLTAFGLPSPALGVNPFMTPNVMPMQLSPEQQVTMMQLMTNYYAAFSMSMAGQLGMLPTGMAPTPAPVPSPSPSTSEHIDVGEPEDTETRKRPHSPEKLTIKEEVEE